MKVTALWSKSPDLGRIVKKRQDNSEDVLKVFKYVPQKDLDEIFWAFIPHDFNACALSTL